MREIYRHLPALASGAAGGWAFSLANAPLPWFFGALFVVAGANLAGWRWRGPRGSRQLGQIFVGSTIGLYFTPAVAAIALAHLPWMLLVAIVSIGLGGVGAFVVGRFAKLDRATGFFGNVPGGMAEMLEFGDRFGAKSVPLTLCQLTRVVIVVMSIPPALTFLGQPGGDIFAPLTREVDHPGLAVLLAGAVAASWALHRLGIPNCWMIGGALFASLLTVFEIELSAMPRDILAVAQVLIGVALGERFDRAAMASAPRVILGSAAVTAFTMATAIGLALFVADRTEIGFTAMIAATAPGGLAEMSLTAAVLNLGVPLVTSYHVVRVLLITLLTLPAYRAGLRLFPPSRA